MEAVIPVLPKLSDLLTGAVRPGVYRWDEPMDVVEVEQPVVLAGWSLAHLDTAGMTSSTEVLDRIGEVLGFPAYYGVNLDALADCLSDLDTATVVLWDHWSEMSRRSPDRFALICRVFADRAEQGQQIAVLLRADH